MLKEADEKYQAGELNKAMELYTEIIEEKREKNKDINGELYYKVGMIANELEKHTKVIEYLELARLNSEVNAESLLALAKSYREIGNLSLEIRRLEDYFENYPDGADINEVKRDLFLALVESKSWKQANDIWPELEGEPHQDELLTEGYFLVNQALGNNEKTEELAEKLLEINKTNKKALEYFAKKYYYRAAERYNKETEAYAKNRTHKQYAQLLDAWSIIHDDFRTARDYFELLYDNYPSSEYASFLETIYTRLDNNAKAQYYKKRANE